jgi:Ca2+-binding RTX toxin-like protein
MANVTGGASRQAQVLGLQDAGRDIDFRAAADQRGSGAGLTAPPEPASGRSPADAPTVRASPHAPAGDGFADIVTATGPEGQIKIFDATTGVEGPSFLAFPGFTGGVRVAGGDVDGDGRDDIIAAVGPGSGGNGQIRVFSGQTFEEISSFFAFPGFSGGVNVATADVDGDGSADIVVGAGAGGGSQVKVFDGASGGLIDSFSAYGAGFNGGVYVAAGDFDGDGRAEVVTAPETGPGTIRVFDFNGPTIRLVSRVTPFGASFEGGISIAAGDIDGDGLADLVAGRASGAAQVRTFTGMDLARASSFTALPGTSGGVRLAAGDWDGDGHAEILTAAPLGSGLVRVFDGETSDEEGFFFATPDDTGGMSIALTDVVREPNVTTGTAGNDLVHVAGDGVAPPPGYADVATATNGNDIIIATAGDDLNHGGGGIDLVAYAAAMIGVSYTDYFGSVSLDTPAEGFDFFDSIEIFRLGDAEIYRSAEGHPRSTTLSMEGGSNTFRVRTTGEKDVTTVAVNQPASAPAFNDTMLIQDVGRLELKLGGGGNDVTLVGDLRSMGLDSLVVDARGGADDTVTVESSVVKEMEIKPTAVGTLLTDFVMLFLADPNAALEMTTDVRGAEELSYTLVNLESATISGDLTKTGLASHSIVLTTGDGDSDLDASGILSNHRVVIDAAGGSDKVYGGAGADILDGGTGNDTIDGGDRNDRLTGAQGVDRLSGGAGNDKVTGGAGADILAGNAGADTFILLKASDSRAAASDRILDLAAGDKIDLSRIDADTGTGGDQAFHLTNKFHGVAGELFLRYSAGPNRTLLQADVDGDGLADLTMRLDGDQSGFTGFVY